jgi:hypothetical protein
VDRGTYVEGRGTPEPGAAVALVVRAAALAGAGFAALACALRWSADAGQWLFDHGRGRAVVPPIAIMKTTPSVAFEVHAATFALVALAVGACAAALAALRGSPRARLVLASSLAAGGFALATRPDAGLVRTLAPSAIGVVVLVAAASGRARPVRVESERGGAPASFVLASAALVACWGAWLALASQPARAAGAMVVAVLFVRAVAASPPSRPRDGRRAAALAPIFVTPLLGLLRAPSITHLALVAFAVLALRALVVRVSARRVPRPDALVPLAVWSWVAVLVVPTRFRDLGSLNHQFHEAGTFAWANAIAHGKLMMADSGLLYGPLRAYATTALAAMLGGLTAEHLRQAQVLLNLLGAAAMIALGSWLVRGRGWALAWLAYLAVVATGLAQFLDYQNLISFGWADLGRIAFPLSAVTLAVRRFASRSSWRALAASGAGLTAAALYGQEFWSAMAAALVVGLAAHVAFAGGDVALGRGSLRASVLGALRRASALALGALGAASLWALAYAARGKLGLFAATIGRTARVFASGQYAARAFAVRAEDLGDWEKLTGAFAGGGGGGAEEGLRVEFLVPPAVYAIACVVLAAKIVERRWCVRASVQAAILAFGVIAFGVASSRSDYVHLLAATPPAILLAVSLAADAVDRAPLRSLRAFAVLAVAAAAFASLHATGFALALAPRIAAVLRGDERPPRGLPYAHPDLPRAGDVFVPGDLEAVAIELRRRTAPGEPVFVNHGFTAGGEVYFLADRPNASRFDLLCEIIVEDDRAEVRAMLARGTPRFVVGADAGMIGGDAYAVLATRWSEVGRYGAFTLLEHRRGGGNDGASLTGAPFDPLAFSGAPIVIPAIASP